MANQNIFCLFKKMNEWMRSHKCGVLGFWGITPKPHKSNEYIKIFLIGNYTQTVKISLVYYSNNLFTYEL